MEHAVQVHVAKAKRSGSTQAVEKGRLFSDEPYTGQHSDFQGLILPVASLFFDVVVPTIQ